MKLDRVRLYRFRNGLGEEVWRAKAKTCLGWYWLGQSLFGGKLLCGPGWAYDDMEEFLLEADTESDLLALIRSHITDLQKKDAAEERDALRQRLTFLERKEVTL